MGTFNESEVIKFLELYKSHECLWKSDHRYYKIKSRRNEAYARIRAAMNLSSILEVKQKIKSFRDIYSLERIKMRRAAVSDNNAGEIYREQLRWYTLADSFFSRADEVKEDNDCIMISENQHSTAFERPSVSVQSPDEYPNITNHSAPFPSNRKEVTNNSYQDCNNLGQLQRKSDPVEEAPNKTDEFYHFGMNIAMQLRSLPLVYALDLQAKIQQMLCEGRIAWEQRQYEQGQYEQRQYEQFDNESRASSPVSLLDNRPSLAFSRRDKVVQRNNSIQ